MSDQDRNLPCPEQEPELAAYLLGELGDPPRARLERHLEQCRGCRRALEDAKAAIEALEEFEEAPLPFEEGIPATNRERDDAWSEFQRRVEASGIRIYRSPSPPAAETAPAAATVLPPAKNTVWLLAAATLLLGILVGRFIPGQGSAIGPATAANAAAQLEALGIDAHAVAALARAELLSDLGVSYLSGLQSLMSEVGAVSSQDVRADDLIGIREQARTLIRDGRLLQRLLDSQRDEAFLRAVDRAELFLEELAAVSGSNASDDVRIIQAALSKSSLGEELGSLDLEKEVALALEASGWIGREERKDF